MLKNVAGDNEVKRQGIRGIRNRSRRGSSRVGEQKGTKRVAAHEKIMKKTRAKNEQHKSNAGATDGQDVSNT